MSDILPQLTVPEVLWLLSTLAPTDEEPKSLSLVARTLPLAPLHPHLHLYRQPTPPAQLTAPLCLCLPIGMLGCCAASYFSIGKQAPHPSLGFGVAQFVSGHWTSSRTWTWLPAVTVTVTVTVTWIRFSCNVYEPEQCAISSKAHTQIHMHACMCVPCTSVATFISHAYQV